MALPQRRPNRLPNYDYSLPGAYFITICTRDRKCIFWDSTPSADVGAAISRPQNAVPIPARLTHSGMIVDRAIQNIPRYYPQMTVDRYVIMPNHVHLLIRIHDRSAEGTRAADSRPYDTPSIGTGMGQLKRVSSKEAGESLWQKSFYDHVVRTEADYEEIRDYIDCNPARWEQDRFYRP